MTTGQKLIAALLILLLGFCVVLYWRQSELKKAQGDLDRKWGRNPFIEPATNGSKTTAP